MNRIEDRFAALKAQGEKALILFVTAGDQPLEELPAVLETLVKGGADVIEVGIPFSDPFGEGVTIQGSSQRSLERGTTPSAILDALKSLKCEVPLVTMGYYNTVLRYGLAEYAARMAEAGVSGSIIQDLVPEEADAWMAASQANGLDTIFLGAPTSTDTRLIEVCRRSSGFVYAISRTGVTGVTGKGTEVPPDVSRLVERIQAQTALPVCVGFGISTPEHVRMVCSVADGAVVGSWLVTQLHERWNGGAGSQEIIDGLQALKAATR